MFVALEQTVAFKHVNVPLVFLVLNRLKQNKSPNLPITEVNLFQHIKYIFVHKLDVDYFTSFFFKKRELIIFLSMILFKDCKWSDWGLV